MAKANPIVSLQVTTHRDYINAVVSRERGSRHHSSITQTSRLRLIRAQQQIVEAAAPDELAPYSFGYEYGTKNIARWTTGALMVDPAVMIEPDANRLPDESDPRFQMLVAAITPETTTELRQLVTTELEAEQRWTAEDIMRREG